jgi:hypothetical protein
MNTKDKHVVEITNYPTYRLISTHTVRHGKTIVSYHKTARQAIKYASTLNHLWKDKRPNRTYTAHVTNDIVNK